MSEIGWRKAMRIAMSYGVKKDSGTVKSYAKRFNLTDEMLEILEQEAIAEGNRPKLCYKCNGVGFQSRFADYLVLCDCLNSKKYPTIGGVTYSNL